MDELISQIDSILASRGAYLLTNNEANKILEAWNRRAEQSASDHIEDVRGMVSDEPVAWEYVSKISGQYAITRQPPHNLAEPDQFEITPLFTRPPQAQPCVTDAELAQKILVQLGFSTDPSMEPGADDRRDRIAVMIAGNSQPRAKCAELEKQLGDLATSIWKAHFKDASLEWGLCDSALGILSQIDNMYAGLREKLAALEAENARLTEKNAFLVHQTVLNNDTIAQQAERIKELERKLNEHN